MSNFIPVSFVDFSNVAIERGYTPVQYSNTGYFIRLANGIRYEWQNTRGGQAGLGYRNRKEEVAALFNALGGAKDSPNGLKYINRIEGSFNYRLTDLGAFFDLADIAGAVELPKTVRGLNSPIASPKAPLVAYAGSEKTKGRSLKGELSPEDIAKIGSDSLARLEAKKGKIA